jgi:hypothetical protein
MTPNESDHAFIYTSLNIDYVKQGKGILKVKSTLLEDIIK